MSQYTTSTSGNASFANPIMQASVTLTPAQIKALDGTPVTIIPAPGAGNVIQVLSSNLIYDFATTPYSNVNSSMTLYYGNVSNLILALFSQLMLTSVVDYITHDDDFEGEAAASTMVNQPVIISQPGAGNYTNGDSPVTVILKYFIFPSGL